MWGEPKKSEQKSRFIILHSLKELIFVFWHELLYTWDFLIHF